MSSERVKQPADSPLSEAVGDFAVALHKLGFAYGVAFIAPFKTESSVLLFRDGMSQAARMNMLCDLEHAVQEAKKAFSI